MTICASGASRASRSMPSTTRDVRIAFVGMLMMPGRHSRYAARMMSTRSRRRNGSPPLKVSQYGAWPRLRNVRSYSSSVKSATRFRHTLQVRQVELQR